MNNWEKHVFDHGPLTQIAPKLWSVTGSLPHGNMSRNMIIYKTDDESLLIHSGIAVNAETVKAIEELGQPRFLVVPNRLHRLDAGVYKSRYPKIKVLSPNAAMSHVGKKVSVDATCESALPTLGITCHVPDGIRPSELCYEVDTGDGKALIMTDLLFNLKHMQGIDGFLLKVIGSTGFFGMTKIGKLFMLSNKKAFKDWLLVMSRDKAIKYICLGHGNSITENVSNRLRAAAERL